MDVVFFGDFLECQMAPRGDFVCAGGARGWVLWGQGVTDLSVTT